MAPLFFLLIFIQYYLSIIFLKNKEYSKLTALYLYAIFSYDFVFINASYYLPLWFVNVTKLYNEYLLIYLIAHYFIVIKNQFSFFNRVDRYVISYFLIPSALILLMDHCGSGAIYVRDTINSIRIYILPVVLPYMLYKCNMLQSYKPQKIINIILTLSIFTGIFGFFQKMSFYGVRSLWFFDFFNRESQNPVLYGAANYIRNGMLRVTGVFVSPITYTITLSISVIIISALLLDKSKKISSKIFFAIVLLFVIYCQHNSQTRVGYIVDVIGVAAVAYSSFFKARLRNILLLPSVVVAGTFAFLLLGLTKDESAIGRLAQYNAFFSYFNILGAGFGSPFVNVYFDTFFLSVGLLYGIFVILPLAMLYKFNKYAFEIWTRKLVDNYFAIAVIAVSATFIYSFTFQFIAGSYPYKLYFLLLFLIFENDKSPAKETGQVNNSRFIPNGNF